MTDFRMGYLYSLAPIHCGGEGDLGNLLEIVREVHTNFPYIPGSSLRGSIRNEVEIQDSDAANTLFGKELDPNNKEQMGVHQVWFGDARLLWVPMRTMSLKNRGDVFTWVSCHSLILAHAIATGKANTFVPFPDCPVGTHAGTYSLADAEITVFSLSKEQRQILDLAGDFPDALKHSVQPVLEKNRIVLPDADFDVLMEHSLWTQIRNKIKDKTEQAGSDTTEQAGSDTTEQAGSDTTEQAGSAEIFWTDICIPRDTILYFNWGYNLLKQNPVTSEQHKLLMGILKGLIQVGGQANVGRGWVHSWVNNDELKSIVSDEKKLETTGV